MTKQLAKKEQQQQPSAINVNGAVIPSLVKDTLHERATIGVIFHFPQTFAVVGHRLYPQDFKTRLSSGVWWAMSELDVADEEITTLSVASKIAGTDFMSSLRDHGVTDRESLTMLLENEYASAKHVRIEALQQYVDLLQVEALNARINGEYRAAIFRITGDKNLSAQETMDALWEATFDLVATVRTDSDAHQVPYAAANYFANLINPERRPIPTGWQRFDNIFAGDYRKTVSVLVGYQGRGKTSFLTSKVYEDIRIKNHVALFTIEQDTQEIASKFLRMMTGLRKKMDTGTVDEADREILKASILRMEDWSLRICDTARTVNHIVHRLKRWALDGFTPDKVYIDGGWLLRNENNEIPQDIHKTTFYGNVIDQLIQRVAKPFDCSVWITFQPNRSDGADVNKPIDYAKIDYGKDMINNTHRLATLHQPETGRDYTQLTMPKDRTTGKHGQHVMFNYDHDFDQYTEQSSIAPF